MELTDKELKYVLNEMHKILLTEDQQSDSMKKAMQLYMKTKGCSKEEADKFIRINIRMMVSCLHQRKPGKFVLGVTRMYLNNELVDEDTKKALDATIEYISRNEEYNHYDKNLNGESAMSLIKRFESILEQERQKQKEQIESQDYKNETEYDIVRIDSFEQSQTYSKYTYEHSRWCITTSEWAFDNYTHNGLSQFYFCLKKGYENIEPVKGENCPLDVYGTSMIAVLVNSKGELEKCTCRWNHDNGGSDNVMNTVEISELIGMNFYSIFKPNNSLGEKLKEIEEKLRNGAHPDEVFETSDNIIDGIYIIRFGGIKNIWNDNKKAFIMPKWFESLFVLKKSDIMKVFILQCDDDNYYLSMNGELYDEDELYHYINNKISNYISEGGTIKDMENNIVDSVWQRYSGDIEVKVLGKKNYLTPDGKIVFKKWYSSIELIQSEETKYYIVQQNNGDDYHLFNSYEEDILGRGYKYIYTNIVNNKWIKIQDSNKGVNYININNPQEIACEKYFAYNIKMFNENLFSGSNKYNECILCDKSGNDLIGFSIKNINSLYDDENFIIEKDDMYNIFNIKTKSILPFWFDRFESSFPTTNNPYLHIIKGERHYLINVYSTSDEDMILFNEYFDNIQMDSFYTKRFILTKNNYKTMITFKGEKILDKWYENIIDTNVNDVYLIEDNSKYNLFYYSKYILEDSKFLFEEWMDNIEVNPNRTVNVTLNGDTKTIELYTLLYAR